MKFCTTETAFEDINVLSDHTGSSPEQARLFQIALRILLPVEIRKKCEMPPLTENDTGIASKSLAALRTLLTEQREANGNEKLLARLAIAEAAGHFGNAEYRDRVLVWLCIQGFIPDEEDKQPFFP